MRTPDDLVPELRAAARDWRRGHPCSCDRARTLADIVRSYDPAANPFVVMKAMRDMALSALGPAAEQTRRSDQAWDEIARLREFGEHYSGAAQDAWDRIVVLEKALRELARTHYETHTFNAERVHTNAHAPGCPGCVAEKALAAGSASPGGDETATHGRHCPCTGCANEDWTRADLAPCGTHGADCPNVYAPAAAAVSTEPAP